LPRTLREKLAPRTDQSRCYSGYSRKMRTRRGDRSMMIVLTIR
jgi:hypothetical protein